VASEGVRSDSAADFRFLQVADWRTAGKRRDTAGGIAKPVPSLPPDCDIMKVVPPTTFAIDVHHWPAEVPRMRVRPRCT